MPRAVPDKLPEEFAPTGPRLSRFPILPAPPIRPRLFPDEARFALRLALLAGGTEFAAWAWAPRDAVHARLWWAGALVLALRVARPFWAHAGTRVSRTALAAALLAAALLAQAGALLAPEAVPWTLAAALLCGLAALGDLAGTCMTDAITVDRRPAALGALEMGQGLGVALGLTFGVAWPTLVPAAAGLALLAGTAGLRDLRDRGTPRSAWPRAAYLSALAAPIGRTLANTAFFTGACAGAALWLGAAGGRWSLLAPFPGMAAAARLDRWTRNAGVLPRALAALALVAAVSALALPGAGGFLALAALGGCASALPASVARGSAEMERASTSSLVWMDLGLGVALGLALTALLGVFFVRI